MNLFRVLLILTTLPCALGSDKLVKVKVEKAAFELVENSLNYPVLIQSRVSSQIKSDGELIVIGKKIQLGQRVKKGDPLLELRHSDLSTNYRNRVLRAPVSGVVAGIHVQAGNYVSKGDLLITLNDPDNIFGRVEIPVDDYEKVKKGLKTELTFGPSTKLSSEVIGVGAMANTELGTVPVEVSLVGRKGLLPGKIGRAKVSLQQEQLLLIDESVLYYAGEDIFVPLLKGDTVRKVPITLGRRFKNKVEVLTGLEEGQTFIIDSPKFLRNKQKVEVNAKKDS